LITAILGVSAAGATFLTLDTRYPQTRLETIIHVTGMQWIIVDRANYQRFSGSETLERKKLQFIFVEDLVAGDTGGYGRPGIPYSPDDPLYIYFTSGTTGKPKGIVGRNNEVSHYLNWEINTMGINETFRFSQFTNPGFDVFLRDIFTALCSGGTLCIPFNIPLEEKSLIRWIDDNRINLIHCVPSLFRVFNTGVLEENHFRSLKYVLLAGEK
ncbi:MAG: AMP-binding protein, partial [bacterium]|nr:AMP-binding protein [bacterium]